MRYDFDGEGFGSEWGAAVLERARYEDIDEVLSLYRACSLYDELHGVLRWDEPYPTYEVVESDLDIDSLYVVRNAGEIIAAMTLIEMREMAGESLGDVPSAGDVMLVARLCVLPPYQRRGIGSRLIECALRAARSLGSRKLSMMCDVNDSAILHLGYKHGFLYYGIQTLYAHAYLRLDREL